MKMKHTNSKELHTVLFKFLILKVRKAKKQKVTDSILGKSRTQLTFLSTCIAHSYFSFDVYQNVAL
jgi:hypothetical protein